MSKCDDMGLTYCYQFKFLNFFVENKVLGYNDSILIKNSLTAELL